MITIKPFKGLRPRKDIVDKVASKPYDVLNSQEAKEEAKDNEFSFLKIRLSRLMALLAGKKMRIKLTKLIK